MSTVRTNAAAAMLGVSPNTLRSWERRFGFPTPRRTPGGHRQFEMQEVEALRQAFEETQNVSSAISLARERGNGPASPVRLRSALSRFDEEQADLILEESLAVRSTERTVQEVLLPALEALAVADPNLPPTPELGFAWRWAGGWLAAVRRVAPPATRAEGVLLVDASRPLDIDALHASALELYLRRAGLRTLALSPDLDPARLARALRALGARAIVLTGQGASLDALGRIVYAARRAPLGAAAGDATVDVFDFRGALPETGASTVARLGHSALEARDGLLAHFDRGGRLAPRVEVRDRMRARLQALA